MEKKETKRRLSWCDWCVLAGVIALVASIAHPPITQAMQEQKLFDMADNLHLIRAQIRVYRTQTGLYPGQQHPDDLSVTGDEFVAALIDWSAEQAVPVLNDFPANPYCPDSAAARSVTCVNDPDALPTGTEDTGWWYNTATGQFCACDSTYHANY